MKKLKELIKRFTDRKNNSCHKCVVCDNYLDFGEEYCHNECQELYSRCCDECELD